jgi:ATP-binding cassette subfamily C protein CydCD
MRPVDPRLLRRARPVRLLLAALTGIGVADALLLITQATMLADLVSRLVVTPREQASSTTAIIALLAASAGRAALVWLREVLSARTGTAVKAALRADLTAHLVTGPTRAADRARTGELAVLATSGVDALDGYFARYLPQLVLASVVPALIGIRILSVDWLSAGIIALTVPLIPLFMVLIGLRTREEMDRRFAALERLGGHFLEVVAGLPTLAAFGRTRGQAGQIRRAADAHRRATLRTLHVAFLSSLALELIAMLSVAMVAAGIGLRLADGSMTLRAGLLVLICTPEVYLPLRMVGARYHEAAEGLAAADRVFAQTAETADAARRGTRTPVAGACIRFEHVGVERTGRAEPTLSDFDFALAPGRVTGLVGASGAGKSTLLHLLLGFDAPSAGRITVDGADLAEYDLELWRQWIAWMPQHPRLTGETVADAIRLGAPDRGPQAIAEAAAAAGIDFPLDTRLGREGSALSGGQARRVALARMILRDAPIVLLDEPTEHLDPETELTVTAALRAWLPGRTVLLVTHRPALLELCDSVVRREAPVVASTAQETDAAAPQQSAVTPRPARATQSERLRIRSHMAAAVALCAATALSAIGLAGSSAWLIATAAERPAILTLQVGIAAVQAFGLGRAALRYAERLTGHDATLRLLAELRVRVYRGLARRAPAGMSAQRGGDLLAALTGDIVAVQDLFLKVLLPATGFAAACVGLLAFDLAVLPAAALVLGLGIAVAGVAAPMLTRFCARSAEQRTATARSRLATDTVDLLDALPDLVAYGAAGERAARIADDDRQLSALERRGALAGGLGAALGTLASGATVAALAGLALSAVAAGRIGGPIAAAAVLAPLALFELAVALPDAARALDRGRAGWDRLRRLAEAEPVVPAPDRPREVAWTGASVLEFDRVAAVWPDADRRAVHDIGFRLHAGEQLTLSGPSGTGKSTIAALASRALDPCLGAVRIDGVDLREADPERVRALVAVAAQDAHLFDTTIRENLLIGRPDAGDDELRAALAAVCLDSWVRALPQGLGTGVGQLGDAVSGGERQRIALARVLLSRAPVVVLDEPTAHLDAETAAEVERNLRRELGGRTVLWIRHALGADPVTWLIASQA